MSLKLGVVMDPIGSIHYKKDTTLALLWAAQDRGWALFYIEPDGSVSRRKASYGDCPTPNGSSQC